MESALHLTRTRLAEIADLESALSVLHWDQATYLPERAATARGHQLATLTETLHGRQTDAELGRLLERSASEVGSLDPESDDVCLVRVAQRDFDRARRVPREFVAELARHTSSLYDAWTRARPANDFASLVPGLQRTLELSRELAAFHRGFSHPADALIDRVDPGMTVSRLRPLFDDLRELLVPMVRAIAEQSPPDLAVLHGDFDESAQLEFGRSVIERMGYDFARGRQDRTHHPFMTRFSAHDVRITTRVRGDDLSEALFSTIHEAGHALYELGVAPDLDRGPLGSGVTAGVHESQSRLWENLVGRSRPFWRRFFPDLQAKFPQLRATDADAFHRAINCVQPSLVRTDADEVTYNLHVLIRFDLELALLEGQLEVRDLPEAWNERYRSDLGVVPTSDSEGVMQDVHWYADVIGGQFQCYAIGNVLSAQLYAAACRARPQILEELAKGEFETLAAWLGENVHRHGRKFEADVLVERATGAELGIGAYRDYLYGKFGELYGIDFEAGDAAKRR
jgi:carboxypeptidase Taq